MTTAVDRNIRAHDRAARAYELRHGEIFNGPEQARLRGVVADVLNEVRTGSTPPVALDFGSGTGNVTRHLLAAGCAVIAADVSARSLDLLRARYGPQGHVRTLMIGDAAPGVVLREGPFDIVCAYSVLHHVPDYIAAVRELVGALRFGGVLYIDHEASPSYWRGDPEYEKWRHSRSWRYWADFVRSLTSNWLLYRLRRLRDPRATEEGDLHVWPDDHVDWGAIHGVLSEMGCVIVREEDHLVYRRHHDLGAYERYRSVCSDTRTLIARKER